MEAEGGIVITEFKMEGEIGCSIIHTEDMKSEREREGDEGKRRGKETRGETKEASGSTGVLELELALTASPLPRATSISSLCSQNIIKYTKIKIHFM